MSQKQAIKKKVTELAQEAVEVAGVELYDVEILGQTGKMTLRITIDSEQGITIQDCETVSRQLEALLDIEDPIPGSYTLEVTSPGIDRPLRNIKEFKRFTGKLARVVTKERIDNQTFFIGRIQEVDDDTIVLKTDKKIVKIPYNIISKANLEIEL